MRNSFVKHDPQEYVCTWGVGKQKQVIADSRWSCQDWKGSLHPTRLIQGAKRTSLGSFVEAVNPVLVRSRAPAKLAVARERCGREAALHAEWCLCLPHCSSYILQTLQIQQWLYESRMEMRCWLPPESPASSIKTAKEFWQPKNNPSYWAIFSCL